MESGMETPKAWNQPAALEAVGGLETNKLAHAFGVSTYTYSLVSFEIPTFLKRDSKCEYF